MRILLRILAVLLFLILFIWWNPEIILNETVLRKVVDFAPNNLSVEWKNLDIDISRGFITKKIDIKMKDLCVRYEKPLDTCVNSLHVNLTFDIKDWKAEIQKIDTVYLNGRFFRFQLEPAEKALKGEKEFSLDLRPPIFLLSLAHNFSKIKNFYISMTTVSLRSSGEKPILVSLKIKQNKIEVSAKQKEKFAAAAILKIEQNRDAFVGAGHISGTFAKQPLQTKLRFVWQKRGIKMEFGNINGRGDLSLDAKLHTKTGYPEEIHLQSNIEGWKSLIPAPMHSLKGPIDLNILWKENKLPESAQFAVQLNTKLKDTVQSFVTKTNGTVALQNPFSKTAKIDLNVESDLQDIALVAPPMRLESPPQILPDKRFVRESNDELFAKKEKSSRLSWKARINTTKPILIHSNLLPIPIPVVTRLDLKPELLSGIIEVQTMPVKIFAKEVELKQLRVTFVEGSELGALDGAILYRNPEVQIRILVLGSTDEPRIEFESDPPLERDQIVSILLFNKPLSELTDEEANSSANMNQALLDGAFGLFSLFYLSSTPIQSLSYDPATEVYSVQLKIGSKTTVSLGSGTSAEKRLGLRRRLGGRWAIRTELQQEQGNNNVLLTLLEWFQRF